MKEIKFRCWDKRQERMWTWEVGNVGFELHEELDAPNSVVMQYTGLKDKNGKEIYEGDIVAVLDEEANAFLDSKVMMCEPEGQWILIGPNGFLDALAEHNDENEIIGNIYEHSHLLKEE